jgi:hypothetical protein
MIWESAPWKAELSNVAGRLERRKSQRRWPAASFARVEMEFFIAFYIVRRLLEARKLSNELVSQAILLQAFAPTGKPVHLMNWERIDELYELSARPLPAELSLREFANEAIHSYVFVPTYREGGGLDGFFLASDHQRLNRLLHVDLDQVIHVLREVAQDEVTHSDWSFDPSKGDWKVLETGNLPMAADIEGDSEEPSSL